MKVRMMEATPKNLPPIGFQFTKFTSMRGRECKGTQCDDIVLEIEGTAGTAGTAGAAGAETLPPPVAGEGRWRIDVAAAASRQSVGKWCKLNPVKCTIILWSKRSGSYAVKGPGSNLTANSFLHTTRTDNIFKAAKLCSHRKSAYDYNSKFIVNSQKLYKELLSERILSSCHLCYVTHDIESMTLVEQIEFVKMQTAGLNYRPMCNNCVLVRTDVDEIPFGQTQCPVCLSKLSNVEWSVRNQCGHVLCFNCTLFLMDTGVKTCPCCRQLM